MSFDAKRPGLSWSQRLRRIVHLVDTPSGYGSAGEALVLDSSGRRLVWQAAGGAAHDSILLFSSGGVSEYDADAAGLTSALAAASSGDTVWLPPGTYAADYTIPAGVTVVGMSREDVIIDGQVTLGDGSVLENLSVVRSVSDANDVYGVLAPNGGHGYLYGCMISVENAGAGGGYGIRVHGRGFIGSEDKPGLAGCHVYGSTADVI